jgi:hypothetical protein
MKLFKIITDYKSLILMRNEFQSYPMDTGGSYPRDRAAGREADNSPLSSTEFSIAWNYASTPPYVFMVRCFVKYWDSFAYAIAQSV